ncbi:MAG: glutathione S-transferase family protein [Hyphomonadaceae bacterium]|nr:glutathione S-transferase family protein [Hyphomonadaceae bacterium]
MTHLHLIFAPGTCSRAVMIALEEAGVEYEHQLLTYMKGEHRTPEYLALNPNGKTPLLIAEGQPIHETSAILLYLAKLYPEAGLLPFGRGEIADAQTIAHLIWCGSELHPNVFRIRIPQFFCDHPEGRLRQKEMAVASMHDKFAIIEGHLESGPWFLGEAWSAIDAYLFWVWFRLDGTGFELDRYPQFADHYRRMQDRPSVQRAMAIEQAAGQKLREEGLVVNFETFRPGRTPEDFQALVEKTQPAD